MITTLWQKFGEGKGERGRKREKTRQKEARSMKNNYREEEINKQRCSKIEKGKRRDRGKGWKVEVINLKRN